MEEEEKVGDIIYVVLVYILTVFPLTCFTCTCGKCGNTKVIQVNK